MGTAIPRPSVGERPNGDGGGRGRTSGDPLGGERSTPAGIADDEEGSLPLSVVVIAENEADRIGTCIESVIAAARRAVPAFEVIVVDSASTDGTVDVASEYPVTVLSIPDEDTVSCGAGRYVGDQVARGELVAHVDGDMRLTEDWLAKAVATLRSQPDVAAVEGWLGDAESDEVMSVNKVGGVTCYDAAALAAVGGFDPFLLGYEDVDVGYRLTAAGHRLLRLPTVSAEHPTDDGAVAEPLRRWRRGYLFAPGQAIRKAAFQPRVLRLLVARQRYNLALAGWLAVGVATAASTVLLVAWLAASVVAAGVLARRLGVGDAVQFVLAKGLGLVGLGYGLTLPSQAPSRFPLANVDVVAEGRVLTGTAPDGAAD